MADIDIDPFGKHKSRTEEPTDENIPLSSVGPRGRSAWEPTLKHHLFIYQPSSFSLDLVQMVCNLWILRQRGLRHNN